MFEQIARMLYVVSKCGASRTLNVAMWRIGLMCQSRDPEVVGSSPAGGEKFAVGQTFPGQFVRGYTPGHTFHPTQVINLGTLRQCGLYK